MGLERDLCFLSFLRPGEEHTALAQVPRPWRDRGWIFLHGKHTRCPRTCANNLMTSEQTHPRISARSSFVCPNLQRSAADPGLRPAVEG